MAIRNIYEVLDEFRTAKTKQDRIGVLRKNDNWALRNVLQAVFHPNVKFNVKVPEYKKEHVPPGMSYDHMTSALQRAYLFQEGNPRTPPALTDKRKEELLIQILESLEPKEAEVFANMLKKDLKTPYLTEALVNEAFDGLLPK
jgi:hypothetical protein